MQSLVSISDLSKTYAGGHRALDDVNLEIGKGEILALLGPNGAGKTTLISIICGIVTASAGSVSVAGYDIVKDFRKTRAMIGLVPQELSTDVFETVWHTVSFSRGLFGKKPDPGHIEKVLRDLSLWDRKDSEILTLSGGMKRRVLIAKALSHEPDLQFLDEPTAGVDVELRQGMWRTVKDLQRTGVTIILTTHYIEEAEEIADRVAVIHKGRIIIVEEKSALMAKLGRKSLVLDLIEPLGVMPPGLDAFGLEVSTDRMQLIYHYDSQANRTGISTLIGALGDAGIRFHDLNTSQSSLEDIFVDLVRERP